MEDSVREVDLSRHRGSLFVVDGFEAVAVVVVAGQDNATEADSF